MDEDRRLTKKELKLQRKLETLNSEKEEKKKSFRKWMVYLVFGFIVFGSFAFLVVQSKNNSGLSREVIGIQVNEKDNIKGDIQASITLVEYSDFECPACAVFNPYVDQMLEKYPKNLRLVYKHFPLSGHKNAFPAAEASEAAGKQGKFWEMHDILFERQTEWAESTNPQVYFEKYAKEMGLDTDQFKKDMGSSEVKQKIEEDLNEAEKYGLNATPSFFINGKKMEPRTFDEFQKIIEKEIKNE